MCTVTYFPTLNGAIITANRDEDPMRNASGISTHTNREGRGFYLAREPLHGGTNMAIGRDGTTWVLLNGAFEPHAFGENYGLSRGLMVLDALDHPNLKAFTDGYDFERIEPFTLLHLGKGVEEVRWDGEQEHYRLHDAAQPQLWASAQLYSAAAIADRHRWFAEVRGQNPGAIELLKFHLHGGDGDPHNDMAMNRHNLVRTVSVTQVYRHGGRVEVTHHDLVNESVQQVTPEML